MQTTAKTLQGLRTERALSQGQVGIAGRHVSRIETGIMLPGSNALAKMVAALNAADPTHPVTPVEVMDACRESQRQAQAAARMVARSAGAAVVGRGARRSCKKPTRTGAA